MNLQIDTFVVAGKPVPPEQMADYALRFGGGSDVWIELYHHGRRVTQPWQLRLQADVPEDKVGANANTT